MSTIVKPIPHTVDLNEPVKKTYIDTLLATEDNLAHRFDITIKKGGEAVTLPDGTAVTAYFIRYSDNATVPITGGAVNGNVASVTLTKACYNKPGQFALIIKVSGGGIVNTVFYGEGTVYTSSTDKVVNDENIVPTLADLLAQIAAMEAGTVAANTATNRANTAANRCEQMQIDANGMAGDSNKLGGKAPEYYTQPRNLLDNSDFKIAQAGYNASHGTKWFVADRWESYTRVTASVSGGIVTLTNTGASASVWQYVGGDISALIGKPITVAMRLSDGTLIAGNKIVPDIPETGAVVAASVSGNGVTIGAQLEASGKMYLSIYLKESQSISFEWCQIFLGSYTAETLPPYVAPDPVLELAKCQAYCVDCSNGRPNDWSTGFVTDSGYVMIPLHTPVPMRKGVVPSPVNLSSMQLYTGSAWVSWPGVSPTLQYANNTLTLQGHISNFTSAGVTLTAGQIFMIKNLPLLSSDL